jgi:hypothetical protein
MIWRTFKRVEKRGCEARGENLVVELDGRDGTASYVSDVRTPRLAWIDVEQNETVFIANRKPRSPLSAANNIAHAFFQSILRARGLVRRDESARLRKTS